MPGLRHCPSPSAAATNIQLFTGYTILCLLPLLLGVIQGDHPACPLLLLMLEAVFTDLVSPSA